MMWRLLLALALSVTAQFAVAQTGDTIEITPLDTPSFELNDPTQTDPVRTDRDRVQAAGGALIRALDKVSGEVEEIELAVGDSFRLGLIEIALAECRYPDGNPSGDAFAWIEVRSPARGTTDFAGWMIASSPALSALDHARYDVWVMRCINA